MATACIEDTGCGIEAKEADSEKIVVSRLKSTSIFPTGIVRDRCSQAAVALSGAMGASVLLLFFGCKSGSRDVNNVTIPRVEYERNNASSHSAIYLALR